MARNNMFVMLILTVTVLLTISGCNESKIKVDISNNSGTPISSVRVEYKGGAYTIQRLESGMTDSHYIKPKSESHLELEYEDMNGKKMKSRIDVYFGSGYSGSVMISIDKENKISWKDNTTVK